MKICPSCNIEHNRRDRGMHCNVCRNGIARYGLDRNGQNALLESQDCKCAVCHRDIKLHQRAKIGAAQTGSIDHCHQTGKVRGVLCHTCNALVGYIENQKIDLDQMKNYMAT